MNGMPVKNIDEEIKLHYITIGCKKINNRFLMKYVVDFKHRVVV